MTLQTRLSDALNSLITKGGTQIRVQYFTSTIGSVYDDDVTWTQSGNNLWTSGLVIPLSRQQNSSDSILLEQGKLIENDKKLYIHGSLVFTGSEMTVSIRIGSPGTENDKQFSMLAHSKSYNVYNIPIYKQVYIREIGNNGSLLGAGG